MKGWCVSSKFPDNYTLLRSFWPTSYFLGRGVTVLEHHVLASSHRTLSLPRFLPSGFAMGTILAILKNDLPGRLVLIDSSGAQLVGMGFLFC